MEFFFLPALRTSAPLREAARPAALLQQARNTREAQAAVSKASRKAKRVEQRPAVAAVKPQVVNTVPAVVQQAHMEPLVFPQQQLRDLPRVDDILRAQRLRRCRSLCMSFDLRGHALRETREGRTPGRVR